MVIVTEQESAAATVQQGGRERVSTPSVWLSWFCLQIGHIPTLQAENHVIPSVFARDLTSDRIAYAAIGSNIPSDH